MSNDLPEGRPILCMDFDGVIHSYTSGWQGADVISDEPVEGAIEFLKEASKYFEIHIFSSRSHQKGGIKAMQNWLCEKIRLEKNCSIYDAPKWLLEIKWPIHKPAAFLSIDDRGFCFIGKFPDPKSLLGFKPWNKIKKLALHKNQSPINDVCEMCGRKYCDHENKY